MEESSVVPDSILDSVKKTLYNVQQVKTHLNQYLSLADPDVLAEMPPLERARALFALAKANTTLFMVRLRCAGIDPDNHPVKSELDRLNMYQDKLRRVIDLSKAPSRPSTTLNYQAATRFIEHSLPDLTRNQRQSMKDISKREGPAIKYVERSAQKKRKFETSERKPVQTAAKEFLEKAARELLGDNAGGFKGPIKVDASDDEEQTGS